MMPTYFLRQCCRVGWWHTPELKNWGAEKRTARLQKLTKSTHSDFELKVARVLFFQFLRWHEFIFREHVLLKCRILSHLRTSHLSAFQSFRACTDLNPPAGRLKASGSAEKLTVQLVFGFAHPTAVHYLETTTKAGELRPQWRVETSEKLWTKQKY